LTNNTSNRASPTFLTGRPICFDLDGTLVKTDLLIEGFLTILSSRQALTCLPKLLASSRADFKRRVSELADLKTELLPYNAELIAFLRQQRQAGRPIVLVTAADRKVAQGVAKHLDLFHEKIPSDGVRHLKGKAQTRGLGHR